MIVPSPPLDAVELPITVGVPPLHIVWPVVLMAPEVNAAFTVITADPLFPVPALLLASVTETNVYVVVAVGLTDIFAPDV